MTLVISYINCVLFDSLSNLVSICFTVNVVRVRVRLCDDTEELFWITSTTMSTIINRVLNFKNL